MKSISGLRFGLMQTKAGLAVLLKNFKFRLNENTGELNFNNETFFLATKNPIILDAERL